MALNLGIFSAFLIAGCHASFSSPINLNKDFANFLTDVKNYATQRLLETNQPFSPSSYPYFNVFPSPITSLYSGSESVIWSSKCFVQNTGYMTISDDKTHIDLTVESEKPVAIDDNSALEKCEDFYMFACAATHQDFVISPKRGVGLVSSKVTIELPVNVTDAEWFDINNKGIRVSLYPNNVATTFSNLLETVALFAPDITGECTPESDAKNMEFMNSYTNFDPVVPVDPKSFQLPDASEIHDGDFFGSQSLTGLGPMMGWATGATTGHTFIAQWIEGELYMCESTTPAVQCTPYQQYMDNCQGLCQIVWAPLSPSARAKYNATAALEFFRSVEGMDYGFRTLLWGWIDDAIANMPCLPPDFESNCGTWNYFETSLAQIDRHTGLGYMIWNPGMAKRLGVSDTLSTAELYQIASEQGLEVLDLIRMPEQDSWLYNTTRNGEPYVGKDMVCDVFVCNMWKAGGLFGDMADVINCGEMTNWDVYVLNFLDANYTQIMGEYSLSLQFDYNSKSPYPHMAEDCSSAPPDFQKDSHC